MAKLLVFLCIALFAMTMVMACNPPGRICGNDADCCAPFVCNPWAGRCTSAPGPFARGGDGWIAPPAAH